MPKLVICHECGRKRTVAKTHRWELYDTPWQNEPNIVYLCSDSFGPYILLTKEDNKTWGSSWSHYQSCSDVMTDSSWSDFRYFTCPVCDRTICEQNPKNGYHSQYRQDEDGERICLCCYEKDIQENGIPREKFERGQLPGMFFNHGNNELTDAGYMGVEGFDNHFVGGMDSAKVIADKAVSLIDSGHKVVVAYESMAITGGEGYVSLYAKKTEE